MQDNKQIIYHLAIGNNGGYKGKTNPPISAMLVGNPAPYFKATAVIKGEITEGFTLSRYKGKRYVLLFFYPKDFSAVCPTELLAFQRALPEFEQRETELVACSTDSEFSHWAWSNTPQERGGIQGITYPLVSDINKDIAEAYDVLAGQRKLLPDGRMVTEGQRVAYRGLFLIDKGGIVRHMLVNDMPLGRSVKEALRMVDALQHWEKHGEVCPVNPAE